MLLLFEQWCWSLPTTHLYSSILEQLVPDVIGRWWTVWELCITNFSSSTILLRFSSWQRIQFLEKHQLHRQEIYYITLRLDLRLFQNRILLFPCYKSFCRRSFKTNLTCFALFPLLWLLFQQQFPLLWQEAQIEDCFEMAAAWYSNEFLLRKNR